MIDGLAPGLVVGLCLVALTAGWIDSIVGGGGVIQLPALLVGLPADTVVATVSGTNKLSSIAGAFAATTTYVRKVRIPWATALAAALAAYGGSTLGAMLIRFVPRVAFIPVIIVAVALVGLYTLRRPEMGQAANLRHAGTPAHWVLAVTLGLACGVWDGLIGPGTGAFLTIGFVGLLGYGFLEATAMSRFTNLTTNAAALLVLGTSGHVLWAIGGCMAAANLVGGLIGSHMAVARGNQFIRRVFLVAILIVEIKLVYDLIALARTA